MEFSRRRAAVLLLLPAISTPTAAFLPVGTNPASSVANHYHVYRGSLFPLYNDVNPSLGGEESFDVDSARKQLKSLFQKEKEESSLTASSSSSSSSSRSSKKGNDDFNIQNFVREACNDRKKQGQVEAGEPVPLDDSSLPSLPPLSTIERDRRQAEIQLLKQLQHVSAGDEAMKNLWDLWYSERGGLALARLQQADQLMGDPTSWQDCETSLLQLINEYGIYFVEPINRLATLYYLQGKHEDSYQLCRLILLKLKPWHVGALAGMVQICINRGDRDEARFWAKKRLPSSVAGSSFPPFLDASNGPQNPRRAEWIEKMVEEAKRMLVKAERTTKQQFGEPETYYATGTASETDWEDEFDSEAWQ